MSNLFSRACTLFVVFGALGIGACASPSGPGAIPSGNQTPGAELGQPSARAVASGLTESSALSPGVTDVTLGEYRLDLYSAHTQPNSLRTSRLGLSSEAAPSQ